MNKHVRDCVLLYNLIESFFFNNINVKNLKKILISLRKIHDLSDIFWRNAFLSNCSYLSSFSLIRFLPLFYKISAMNLL